MTTMIDDRPDQRQVRAVSGLVSEVERMWEGLPSRRAMKTHLDALQDVLADMLPSAPRPDKPATPDKPPPPDMATVHSDLVATLEQMGSPEVVTLVMVRGAANGALADWLNVRGNGQRFASAITSAGYEQIANPTSARSAAWLTGMGYVVIYARCDLSHDERIAAAEAFVLASRTRKDRAGESKTCDAPSGNRPRARKITQRPLSPTEPAGTAERPEGHEE